MPQPIIAPATPKLSFNDRPDWASFPGSGLDPKVSGTLSPPDGIWSNLYAQVWNSDFSAIINGYDNISVTFSGSAGTWNITNSSWADGLTSATTYNLKVIGTHSNSYSASHSFTKA